MANWQISDLLARRDGEPHDATLMRPGDGHETVAARLDEIKSQLNALDDVPIDDGVWASLATAQHRASGRRFLRYPWATAAAVFLACMLGVAAMLPISGEGPGVRSLADGDDPKRANAAEIPSAPLLAQLMRRSRDLEMRLAAGVHGERARLVTAGPPEHGATDAQPRREEAVMLYRLADVDAEIAHLYDAATMDESARLNLWAQRVRLLETLVVLREGSAAPSMGLTRSM